MAFNATVLQTIIDYSLSEGPILLKPFNARISVQRYFREFERGDNLNVIFMSAITDVSKSSHVIEIPVMRGLLGYRQFILHKGNKSRFNKVHTLDALRKWTVGQIEGWPDLDVYRANEFSTIGSHDMSGLFRMLVHGRYDLLPLGLVEIEAEYNKQSSKETPLIRDNRLIVYYPWPIFLAVHERETALAKIMSRALTLMAEDGTLDNLVVKFFSVELQTIKRAGDNIIHLDNPFLPAHLRPFRFVTPTTNNSRPAIVQP
ncbi:MAG: hypothetical protein COA42_15670 [Alteromonadaceae bacterium]|nr:MAG: hypothetical protein COA42_15670 [Alteromonadaceae bacterium]